MSYELFQMQSIIKLFNDEHRHTHIFCSYLSIFCHFWEIIFKYRIILVANNNKITRHLYYNTISHTFLFSAGSGGKICHWNKSDWSMILHLGGIFDLRRCSFTCEFWFDFVKMVSIKNNLVYTIEILFRPEVKQVKMPRLKLKLFLDRLELDCR